MARRFHKIWCDECGVEIIWGPVVIDGRHYCCHDCAVGLECDCASANSRWENDAEFLWIEGVEGNIESTYGIDYGFD
jgi:hypothetical protein